MKKTYSELPTNDVYVYSNEQMELVCALCIFGDMVESSYRTDEPTEMLGHLRAHKRAGHRLPPDLLDRIIEDFPSAAASE